MAPLPITEDYYMVLEVGQTATRELIIRSYKRLALKLHPDRNGKHDATDAFQLLGRAYETLNDESKRRAYDLIYPSLRQNTPFPQTAETQSPHLLSEAAQIAALQKSRQERNARWWIKKNAFDLAIFEVQRDVGRLEQAIKNLQSIVAAEAAAEAQKNSWGTWLLSPLYKKAEESEEDKARKDRERQERRIEKDMKERRLSVKQAELKKQESLSRKAKQEVDTADLIDAGKIQLLQNRIRARETREREEREQAERERLARIWKQQQELQEKRNREAAETLRKQQAEAQKLREEQQAIQRQRTIDIVDEVLRNYPVLPTRANLPTGTPRTYSADLPTRIPRSYTLNCCHDGWWLKIQGRKACPECYDVWTYLLQCPGCQMEACPKCQSVIKPKLRRRAPRTTPRARARSPSPEFDYDYDSYF